VTENQIIVTSETTVFRTKKTYGRAICPESDKTAFTYKKNQVQTLGLLQAAREFKDACARQ